MPAAEKPPTVYVIDDTELARTGLQLILESRDFQVLGAAAPVAALNRIPALKPDTVLLRDCDAHLSVMTALTAQAERAASTQTETPGTQSPAFLMLTGSSACDVSVMDALAAGVDGVADGTVTVDSLALALSTIAAGHMWIEASAAQGMRERITQGAPSGPLDTLTPMENSVAELLAQGLTNRDIAEQLHLAEKTVKNYVSKILRTLGVSNRTQAGMAVRDALEVGS